MRSQPGQWGLLSSLSSNFPLEISCQAKVAWAVTCPLTVLCHCLGAASGKCCLTCMLEWVQRCGSLRLSVSYVPCSRSSGMERWKGMVTKSTLMGDLTFQDPQQNFSKVIGILPSALHSQCQPCSWPFIPFLDSQFPQSKGSDISLGSLLFYFLPNKQFFFKNPTFTDISVLKFSALCLIQRTKDKVSQWAHVLESVCLLAEMLIEE